MDQKQFYGKRNPVILTAVAAFLFFSLSTVSASDIPPIPTTFYGAASIDGEYLGEGTTITAKINGVEKGSIQIQENGVFGGSGGFDPKLLVRGTNDDVQEIIKFFAGEEEFEQTAVYDSQTHQITLSIGELPSTSSSNSGRRTDIDLCAEDWNCTEWSECDRETSIQTRECTDLNDCGTQEVKPGEEKDCVYIMTLEEQEQAMIEYEKMKEEEQIQESEPTGSEIDQGLVDSSAKVSGQEVNESQESNNQETGIENESQLPIGLIAGIVLIVLFAGAAGYFFTIKKQRGVK